MRNLFWLRRMGVNCRWTSPDKTN